MTPEATARQNFDANAVHQTARWPAEVSWAWARDGALQAVQPGGRWAGDCSVPRLAAQRQLGRFVPDHAGVAIALPRSAHHVRVLLERVPPGGCLWVMFADEPARAVALATCDFSTELASGRLQCVLPGEVADRCLAERGLAPPQCLAKTPDSDEAAIEAVVPELQALHQKLAETPVVVPPATHDTLILHRGDFRLWQDAGHALPQLQVGDRLDRDDARQHAAAHVAARLRQYKRIVTHDLIRGNLLSLLPDNVPLTSWLTEPHVVPRAMCGPSDRLEVADAAWLPPLRAAGWGEHEVSVRPWPTQPLAAGQGVAIFADLADIEQPATVRQSGSVESLWDGLANELERDPFAALPDPAVTVAELAEHASIPAGMLQVSDFVNHLILPRVHAAAVKLLRGAGVGVKIYGSGWQHVGIDAEPINSRADFTAAIAAASMVLTASPAMHTPQVEALGRRAVPIGRHGESLIRAVRGNARRAA